MVVYDEAEEFRIAEDTLRYPYFKRKSYVGPAIRLPTRVFEAHNYPPYLHLDDRDLLTKPRAQQISMNFIRSFVDLGIGNFWAPKATWVDRLIAFFLVDQRNVEEFEPFANDFEKLQLDGYEVGEFSGFRDPKFCPSFEDLLVFELKMSDDILMSRRKHYSHFDWASAVGGLAVVLHFLLGIVVRPFNSVAYQSSVAMHLYSTKRDREQKDRVPNNLFSFKSRNLAKVFDESSFTVGASGNSRFETPRAGVSPEAHNVNQIASNHVEDTGFLPQTQPNLTQNQLVADEQGEANNDTLNFTHASSGRSEPGAKPNSVNAALKKSLKECRQVYQPLSV